MKRFLAVGLTLVISMFALSCQKIVDDTTEAVKDDLTFADSPVWEGSVWSGTKEADILTKYVAAVTATSESEVRTRIPLGSESIVMTFNADKTFTKTNTKVYTAAAETNYIDDNYMYSEAAAFFNPPDRADNVTYYSTQRIAGQSMGYPDNDLLTIGTTANAEYDDLAVFPVTYATAKAGLLSGKTYYTGTTTGTWEMVQTTTDPLNKTSYLKLTPVSSAGTSYDYYENAGKTAVLTDTSSSTYTFPAGETWEFWATKAIDAEGKDVYYVNWDSAKLTLN